MYRYSPSTRGFYVEGLHQTIPGDALPVSDAQHQALMDGQSEVPARVIVPGPDGYPVLETQQLTREQRIRVLERAVQGHLDDTAEVFGYDDIRSAVTYAEEPAVAKFQAEGRALRAWRSLVWAKCYELLAQANAGVIGEPSAQELVALLPPAPELT